MEIEGSLTSRSSSSACDSSSPGSTSTSIIVSFSGFGLVESHEANDLDDHSRAVSAAGTTPQSTAASAMSLSSATRLAT